MTDIPKLTSLTPNTAPTPSQHRDGLEIRLPMSSAETTPIVSDVWTVAGWSLQFVRLGANQAIGLDQDAGVVHVKVITGEVRDLGDAFAADRVVRDTRVAHEVIETPATGALLAVLTRAEDAPEVIGSMDQLRISGPLDELLQWQSFEQKFSRFLDYFNGLDAHIVPGFHLLDGDGAEIAYVFFWTAGKGVDLSTHNHANDPSATAPAFAEVHWVFNNGTGQGGMYETPEPGAAERTRYPMQRGQEHGPFFATDAGQPRLRANGAVDYPWHGWQAGSDESAGQAYDFVAAFEINPDYARLSS